MQIEIQCSKNYFNFFLSQEAGAFGNNIENEPQEPRPKLKKYVYYIFTEKIALPPVQCKWQFFCKNVLIL